MNIVIIYSIQVGLTKKTNKLGVPYKKYSIVFHIYEPSGSHSIFDLLCTSVNRDCCYVSEQSRVHGENSCGCAIYSTGIQVLTCINNSMKTDM